MPRLRLVHANCTYVGLLLTVVIIICSSVSEGGKSLHKNVNAISKSRITSQKPLVSMRPRVAYMLIDRICYCDHKSFCFIPFFEATGCRVVLYSSLSSSTNSSIIQGLFVAIVDLFPYQTVQCEGGSIPNSR